MLGTVTIEKNALIKRSSNSHQKKFDERIKKSLMNDESLMRVLTLINKGTGRNSHHFIKNIRFLKQQIKQIEMKEIKQTSDRIIIEFDILEFDDIQDFFEEQTESINATGKFNYDTIQKLLSIKLENSTLLNDKRLQRIDQMLQKIKKY